MNNIVTLTKVLLKNNLFSASSKKNKKSKGDKSAIVYIAILAIYFLIFSIPIIYLLKDVLTNYDFSELILSFALPIGGITAMVFGIFSITNIFYFNKDSEQFLPLPIKSSELLVSKFLASLVSEYFILFMFIFPIVFGVGIGINASFLYYLYAISICILMPVIPSVIISIIMMLINKIVNIGKRKNLFMYSMIVVLLIFSLGYGLGIGHIMGLESQNLINILISGQNSNIVSSTRYIFPFFNSGVYSLIHYNEFIGFASFMTFIGLNVLFMAILYFLGDLLYIKGLTKDNGYKKEKKNIEEVYKEETGGILKFLIKKEWLSITRTPIYMLNIVIMNLLMPIVFLLTFIISYNQELSSGFNNMINFNNAGIYFIVVSIVFFLSTFGGTTGSSSAISREGKSAYIMKSIPVSLKTQIDAKVYFSTIIDMVVAVLIEIPFMLLLNIPWWYIIVVNVPLLFLVLIINYISVLLDLKKPKLTWSDESEAIKQNFTVMIGIIISMVIITILVLCGALLWNSNFNIYLAFLLFTIAMVVCYILLALYVKKNQIKLFSKVG